MEIEKLVDKILDNYDLEDLEISKEDFKNYFVKILKDKDEDFIDSMLQYFKRLMLANTYKDAKEIVDELTILKENIA